MLLAIDTATRWTGLALHDGTSVIEEHGWRSHNTQTVEVAPAVDQMLARAGVSVEDLTGIAVTLGPGSYTGLRIGLGFAKGLALAQQMPIVGIPTLEIVAAALPQGDGKLVVVAEAGRTRITTATYRWQRRGGWQAADLPVNETWDTLLERVEPPVAIAGELSPAALKQIRVAGKGYRAVAAPARVRRAAVLADLAWQRLRRGDVDDPAQLTPLYLREP